MPTVVDFLFVRTVDLSHRAIPSASPIPYHWFNLFEGTAWTFSLLLSCNDT